MPILDIKRYIEGQKHDSKSHIGQICNSDIAQTRHPEKFTFKAKCAAPTVGHPLGFECDLFRDLP